MTLVILMVALAAPPTAIVDSVRGVPGLAPLQLLAPGTELALPPRGRVRLAYFASCVHETVRGGHLRIGVTASLADDAVVERVTADCAPPASLAFGGPGALILRDAAAAERPALRLRTRAPVLLTAAGVSVRLREHGAGGALFTLPSGAGRVNLARYGIALEPGALYRACVPRGCRRLWIDPAAHGRAGPVLERVARLP